MSIEDKLEVDRLYFSAFVSYSHADANIAEKLHRKIETYKLPKVLRTINPKDQRRNGRLGPVFRDREDLPATLDLSESVKAALAQSQVLIVLCSPNAKNSPWVAKEIELFRELHPDRPILAALVAGEPEESFPPALTQEGEPLAADLRKKGDGWRLGLLKLVAGVAEVPLDALVQRDAQRQFRSVMAVTLATTIGLLTMIGMTYYAIQQRDEAQHQQAQAEGLVEYMLTDLRSELRGVGRLDVMTNVNERAMDYYEEQGDLGDMSAESLQRRARVLHAMGEDDEKRGDLNKALAKFTEAHMVTEELLNRVPENTDRIFAHAQSEYWLGYVSYLRKDWNATEHYWREYRRFAELLVKEDNQSPKWLRELGYAEGNLCTLQIAVSDMNLRASDHCDVALTTMQVVSKKLPDNAQVQSDLANRHGWMADALDQVGSHNEAFRHRRKQIQIVSSLIEKEPKNIRYVDQLMRAVMVFEERRCKIGSTLQDFKINHKAHQLATRLVKQDPSNERWKSWLARIQINEIGECV